MRHVLLTRDGAAVLAGFRTIAILLLAAAALVAVLAAPGLAKKKGEARVDVVVVDTGLRKFNEEASRLRTLSQVLAPGSEVRIVHYSNLTEARLKGMAPRAVILAPSPDPWSRYPAKPLAQAEAAIRSWRGPLLGIGGGHQLVARAWGAEVRDMADEAGEFGAVRVRVVREDPLWAGLPLEFEVMTGHREEVAALPAGFVALAEGDACRIQAMRHESRPIYGLQFRPEDPRGARLAARGIIRNFLVIARVAKPAP